MTVFINIIENNNKDCNFWISKIKKGELSVTELIDIKNTYKMLMSASNLGILENDSFMLTDNEQSNSRYVYFFKDDNYKKIQNILNIWKPKELGLYFDPFIFKNNDICKNLYKNLIKMTIIKFSINNFFLILGNHSYNDLINLSLSLKLIDNFNIRVMH